MEKATFVGKLRAMMRIDIITVLPELLQSPLNYSILKRAQDKKLVEIVVHNLRDYSLDNIAGRRLSIRGRGRYGHADRACGSGYHSIEKRAELR